MSVFQMKADNDYHYLLFQVLKTTSISLSLVWCATLYSLHESGGDRIELFYKHFPLFWLVSGSIMLFLIMPYYTCKAAHSFGFASFDFLDEWSSGKRSIWNRKKIIRNFSLIFSFMILSFPLGAIKSYLILNRYEVETWSGYITISLIVGFMMCVIVFSMTHLLLSLIQYRFFFSKIPSPTLHDLNHEGDNHGGNKQRI